MGVAGSFLFYKRGETVAMPEDTPPQPQGCPSGCSSGQSVGQVLPPAPAYRPGGREDKQLSHLAGRFMVLLEEACPGPLQPRMALEAGTVNPARYFL